MPVDSDASGNMARDPQDVWASQRRAEGLPKRQMKSPPDEPADVLGQLSKTAI
jgi:hypothetical protein